MPVTVRAFNDVDAKSAAAVGRTLPVCTVTSSSPSVETPPGLSSVAV